MNTCKMMAAGALLLFGAEVASADEPADVSAVLESYSTALAAEDASAAESWVLADGDDFTIVPRQHLWHRFGVVS